MRDFHHRDSGLIEGSRDRDHLLHGELMPHDVRSVAQRNVANPEFTAHAVSSTPRRARAAGESLRAISSPTRTAAAVMMSRFPEYRGRKSPAPSTSIITVTRSS